MVYLFLILLIAFIDQITKLMVQAQMQVYESFPVLEGVLWITYAQNRGAAFSILQSQTVLLIIVTVAVFGFVWWKRRHFALYPPLFRFGLITALGGALGNLIDRIRLGYVVDFIDFHFWPVFNVADIAIVVGVSLVFYVIIRNESLISDKSGQEEVIAADTKALKEDG